jgi:hypothetical protein
LTIKNYLIQLSNGNYNKQKTHDSINIVTKNDDLPPPKELIAEDTYHTSKELKEFIQLMLEWFDKHLTEILPHNYQQRNHLLNLQIAKELLKCFTEFPDSLMESRTIIQANGNIANQMRCIPTSIVINHHIAKMVGIQSHRQAISCVRKRLFPHIKRLYQNYIETGEIEPMEEIKPGMTKMRSISFINGKKVITGGVGPTIEKQMVIDNKKKRNHPTKQQVQEIRQRYAKGDINIEQLRKQCGYNRSVIRRIIKGQSYPDSNYTAPKTETVRRGEQCPRAKLSSEKVMEIITKSQTTIPHKALAEQYGVSLSCIRSIVSGRSWKSITGIATEEKTVTVPIMDVNTNAKPINTY